MQFRRRVYLDYAAGAAGNPSSPHAEGRRAKDRLEAARRRIARLIEAKPDDVIFTSGATEANALSILGFVQALTPRMKPHVLYLPSAHASVTQNVQTLREHGAVIEALPIQHGRVDTATLAKMLRPETVLVALEAVCGETGIVWNTRDVRHTLDALRAPSERIMLHVDASQAPLTEKLSRARFGADLLTLDGAKVGTQSRVGCLVVSRTITLAPLYSGGGQERGLRPGTEDVVAAEQLATCLERAAAERFSFYTRAARTRSGVWSTIKTALPDVLINEGPQQAPHILNLSLPGRDTDYLVALLDEAGFAVSTKSACETDSEEGSRAVRALFGDQERARATLRISWGPSVTASALARFARALIRAVTFLDRHAER